MPAQLWKSTKRLSDKELTDMTRQGYDCVNTVHGCNPGEIFYKVVAGYSDITSAKAVLDDGVTSLRFRKCDMAEAMQVANRVVSAVIDFPKAYIRIYKNGDVSICAKTWDAYKRAAMTAGLWDY